RIHADAADERVPLTRLQEERVHALVGPQLPPEVEPGHGHEQANDEQKAGAVAADEEARGGHGRRSYHMVGGRWHPASRTDPSSICSTYAPGLNRRPAGICGNCGHLGSKVVDRIPTSALDPPGTWAGTSAALARHHGGNGAPFTSYWSMRPMKRIL